MGAGNGAHVLCKKNLLSLLEQKEGRVWREPH